MPASPNERVATQTLKEIKKIISPYEKYSKEALAVAIFYNKCLENRKNIEEFKIESKGHFNSGVGSNVSAVSEVTFKLWNDFTDQDGYDKVECFDFFLGKFRILIIEKLVDVICLLDESNLKPSA